MKDDIGLVVGFLLFASGLVFWFWSSCKQLDRKDRADWLRDCVTWHEQLALEDCAKVYDGSNNGRGP